MANETKRAVQERLRAALVGARKGRQLTQAELAERLSRSQSFVAKYESGERRLDIVDVLLVCAALGVNPGELITQVAEGLA